jgi:hypothetical protein
MEKGCFAFVAFCCDIEKKEHAKVFFQSCNNIDFWLRPQPILEKFCAREKLFFLLNEFFHVEVKIDFQAALTVNAHLSFYQKKGFMENAIEIFLVCKVKFLRSL